MRSHNKRRRALLRLLTSPSVAPLQNCNESWTLQTRVCELYATLGLEHRCWADAGQGPQRCLFPNVLGTWFVGNDRGRTVPAIAVV